MREAVIVSAVRSPMGKYRGALTNITPHELAATVLKEAVKRSKVDPEEIGEVIYSNIMEKEYNNIARYVALEAGLPISVPGITIDRQCGSSLNGIAYAALLIMAGQHDVVVTGGVEMDTRRPWLLSKPTQPYQIQEPKFLTVSTSPVRFEETSMLGTAENLAEMYNLTKEDVDKFAVESHRRAAAAWANHAFDEQIIPIEIKDRKGKVTVVDTDETIRPETSMETLAKLPIASGKKDGICTAGNSSPLTDGASAVVVMEKNKAIELGCEILGTFKGYESAGVDPRIMGIGPVYAVRKLLDRTGLKIEDIDLIEMNEAFAAQSLPCIKELGMDTEKLNVNGGAIALGHPLAATGGVLTAKLLYEMKKRDAKRGIVTFCCAGGQGVAALFERE
jgi:acetyl-CoA C-acetyltransferase